MIMVMTRDIFIKSMEPGGILVISLLFWNLLCNFHKLRDNGKILELCRGKCLILVRLKGLCVIFESIEVVWDEWKMKRQPCNFDKIYG